MIVELIRHFSDLNEEIENVRPAPAIRDFYIALAALMKDCQIAMDDYFVSFDDTQLHKALIMAGLDFTARWDAWLAGSAGFDSPVTRVFHEIALRHFKGILKAWRIWRIDITK